MRSFSVEVSAYLNKSYTVTVDAEDEEMAYIEAEAEVYGVIDPRDIDVDAIEAEEL